jgi:outer membrane protein OmpA-like peptidoglycan-associated protein
MKKVLLLLISLLLTAAIFAQNIATTSPIKKAKVEGNVVDMKSKQPKNNELVIFKSHNTNEQFQAVSDGAGKFSTLLPVGDQYEIFVLGFNDTISHNLIDIPRLEPGDYYKDPFVVNLEFDPPTNFVLENVEFDFGKAVLRPQSYETLNKLAEYLKRRSEINIEIDGHTDNIGSHQKNLKLSLERAKSVSDYLVKKGINVERISVKGYGDWQPVSGNNSGKERQENRRIEVKVLDQ